MIPPNHAFRQLPRFKRVPFRKMHMTLSNFFEKCTMILSSLSNIFGCLINKQLYIRLCDIWHTNTSSLPQHKHLPHCHRPERSANTMSANTTTNDEDAMGFGSEEPEPEWPKKVTSERKCASASTPGCRPRCPVPCGADDTAVPVC